MSSVFDQKIAAVRDKIPESVLETPWKRTLLLVAFLVVGIAAVLFFAIINTLKVIFKESEKSSDFSTPVEDERTQVEIDAEAATVGWFSLDPKVFASPMSAEYFADEDDGQR